MGSYIGTNGLSDLSNLDTCTNVVKLSKRMNLRNHNRGSCLWK